MLSNKRKQGIILIVVGLALIVGVLAWRFWQERVLSFSQVPAPALFSQKSPPKKIIIPKVGLSLAVEEGQIKDGVWSISVDGASHLNLSANPGEGGNVVIYGHNKTKLFGPIRWLGPGDEIKLEVADGEKYVYRVEKTDIVFPDNLTYVLSQDAETLTLYTCIGFADTKRFIVVAKPI